MLCLQFETHMVTCVMIIFMRDFKKQLIFSGTHTILQDLVVFDLVMLDSLTKKEYLIIKTRIAYVKEHTVICNLSQCGYVQS
jgi:hypothetical protein